MPAAKSKPAVKKAPATKKPSAKVPAPRLKAEAANKRAARAMAKPEAVATAPRLTAEVITIPHNQIAPSPLNPRKTVREGYIEELAESLLAKGQLQNISVREVKAAKGAAKYQIIYGEQRWTALSLLIKRGDLPADTPVLARIMSVDDGEHIELAILENQAREDVHPLEQAEAYARLAEIRREQLQDDTAVTRMIAERTGQTMRNIQFQLQVARNLSPKAKEAWREGTIRTRKIAIELARWPQDVQDDALEGLRPDEDHDDLREWLTGESPRADSARFDLELYTAAGGTIISGEDGDPDRLADKGLATRLQREWAIAEAKRLTEVHGLGLPPAEVEQRWNLQDGWAKAGKKEPKANCGIRWFMSTYSFEVEFFGPAVCTKASAVAKGKAKTGVAEPGGVQPLSRRNWIAGATARTRAVQEAVRSSLHQTHAVTLIALLRGSIYYNPLCQLRNEWTTGDAAEVRKALPAGAPELLKGLPGFTKDGEVKDAALATFSLLGLTEAELSAVFCEVIAVRCLDMSMTAGPGAKGESLAIINGGDPDTVHGLCTAEWLKAYSTSQLMALAYDSGAVGAMNLAGKPLSANKSYLVSTLPDFIPPAYVPPEARFLHQQGAEQAVAAMLAKDAG